MRWMVIYEYEVPGGALNLGSTKLHRPWSVWESSPSRKNSHGRTGNRTRDLIISSQKLWPLDHQAGHTDKIQLNIWASHKHELNKRKQRDSCWGAWKSLQYCQLRMKIPAIFRGMFKIFRAISKLFMHSFYYFSRNAGRQTLTCTVVQYTHLWRRILRFCIAYLRDIWQCIVIVPSVEAYFAQNVSYKPK
jgi:hypothetical protein